MLTNSGEAPPFACDVLSTAAPPSIRMLRERLNPPRHPWLQPLRSFARIVKDELTFPDPTASWIPRAVALGSSALANEKFDAIFSTAHPASAHVIAWILARRFGLPWIADYRDPWYGNRYVRHTWPRTLAETLFERGMLHRANAITTISDSIAAELAQFHRRRDVTVIPNAYDPSEWADIPPALPSTFDLCYTGSMYDGKRDPSILFRALAELRNEGDRAGAQAHVHFYGPSSEFVTRMADNAGVGSIVVHHGTVPRSEAMRRQRRSAALLIFLNMDPKTASEMGSKYLEYIGAGRPILVFGPRGSALGEFIKRSELGWFASDVSEAKTALRAAYTFLVEGKSMGPRSAVPDARELARAFTDVFDEVTPRSASAAVMTLLPPRDVMRQ